MADGVEHFEREAQETECDFFERIYDDRREYV